MTGAEAFRPGRTGRPRDDELDTLILDSTLELLAERGYQALTIDEIAGRSGVSRATIYRRWPGKLAVSMDALGRTVVLSRLPPGGDAVGDLRAVTRDWYARIGGSLLGRALVVLAAEVVGEAGLSTAYRERFVWPVRRVLLDCLQRGIAQGRIRPDLDLDLVVDLLVGPRSHRWLFSGEPPDAGLADRLVDLVLRGAGVPAAGGSDVPTGPYRR